MYQRVPTGVNVWMGQRDGKSGAPCAFGNGNTALDRLSGWVAAAHARPHLALSISHTRRKALSPTERDVMLYQPTAHDVMLYRSISSGALFDYIYIYVIAGIS